MGVMAIPGPAPTEHTEQLLARAEANLTARRAADAEQLIIAREWALAHAVSPAEVTHHGTTHTRQLGAVAMRVWEYAAAELGLAFNTHALAAQKIMADALDLASRLPHAWNSALAGDLPAWTARKLATLTRDLTPHAARLVDHQLAGDYATLPPGRLLSAAEGRVAAADTTALDDRVSRTRKKHEVATGRPVDGTTVFFARMDAHDAARLHQTCNKIADLLEETEPDSADRPTRGQLRAQALGLLADPQAALDLLHGRDPHRGKAIVYVHLTPATLQGHGVARVEDLGPHTKKMLADLLGHDHITLKPAIDLNTQPPPADSYEIPTHLAEHIHLTKPADIYPWAESLSRRTDLDHTNPWPAGKTEAGNLAKLTRRHHRIKTHARGWTLIQFGGNKFLWRTPHRRCVSVDRGGTHPHWLELTWPDLRAPAG